MLTKYKRNEIYQALVAAGLEPVECELYDKPRDDQTEYAHIKHPASRSYIVMERRAKGSFTVHKKVGEARKGLSSLVGWEGLLDAIRLWAGDVRSYVDAPDLWDQLRQERDFFAASLYEKSANTPFTLSERMQIAIVLEEIKASIAETYSLSSQQMTRVEARLDEAEAASHRIGRKDWGMLFAGTAFSLIVTDLLSLDIVQHILTLAIQGLGHLFGGTTPPLP